MAEAVVCESDKFPAAFDAYLRTLPASDAAAMKAWASTFYPFQLRWLFETARRAAAVKSRQIGWSHTSAANAVIWSAFHGELTTVISKGERESLEVLDKSKRHAQVLAALGSTLAVPMRANQEVVEFASGGKILALPASGGRSFTGNVILDEYGYHQDATKVWDAAAAVTMLGNFRLRVISTPNGVGNDFADLVEAIRKGKTKKFKLHEVSIDEAIAEGFPVDLEECWDLAKGDPRVFDQLFRCKFLDNQLQFIPSAAVNDCTRDVIQRAHGDRWYAGLDIGRTADRTVLIVIYFHPDGVRAVQWIASAKRTDVQTLQQMVASAFKVFPLRRLCVDATGIGAFEAERMGHQYRGRVEAVNFSPMVKEDLATHMYTCFTQGEIVIPAHDRSLVDSRGKPLELEAGAANQLRDDICAIRRIITSSGGVRYDAPHTAAGHADSAWALGLALHACRAPTVRRDYSSLPDMS